MERRRCIDNVLMSVSTPVTPCLTTVASSCDGPPASSVTVGIPAEVAAARKAAARPKPKAVQEKPAEPKKKERRIAPWEERELQEIEDRIGALEEEVAALDARLADPDLYAGPRGEAERVQEERAAKAGELEALYPRWEELESLR